MATLYARALDAPIVWSKERRHKHFIFACTFIIVVVVAPDMVPWGASEYLRMGSNARMQPRTHAHWVVSVRPRPRS